MLFCDNINLYNTNSNLDYPFDILFAEKQDINKLKIITNDKSLDARYRVLAYNALLSQGIVINQKELLGVIVEVSMPQGLDVLAAFLDGTARYINHSEKNVSLGNSNRPINSTYQSTIF